MKTNTRDPKHVSQFLPGILENLINPKPVVVGERPQNMATRDILFEFETQFLEREFNDERRYKLLKVEIIKRVEKESLVEEDSRDKICNFIWTRINPGLAREIFGEAGVELPQQFKDMYVSEEDEQNFHV